VTRRTSSCRIYSTTHHNGRRRGHREGERASTLTVFHSCHCPRIPFRHVLIERMCAMKHYKKREGCNKEKKDQSHHTNNNKRSSFKPQPQRKNKTCETCDPANLELLYIYSTTTHHNGRRRGHREGGRESTLTVIHSCHRPRIPGGHVLIERNCVIKHCKKKEGCNKEKKDQTHHTNNNNKVPFQTTTTKKEQNV